MVVGKVYQKVLVQWYWELHQSVDQNWAPACQCGTRPYWATCWFRNKLELRINNKIRVCNKNDKSVKMLIMWCFRWGKFVYPSSAVPPTDEDLIMEVEEQVISTHTYIDIRFWQVLLYHLHLRLAPTHPLSWAPFLEVVSLSELPLLSLSAASSIEKAEGSHLLSAQCTITSFHVINMCPTGSLLGDLFVVWSPL